MCKMINFHIEVKLCSKFIQCHTDIPTDTQSILDLLKICLLCSEFHREIFKYPSALCKTVQIVQELNPQHYTLSC